MAQATSSDLSINELNVGRISDRVRQALDLRNLAYRTLTANHELVWHRSCEIHPISEELLLMVRDALPHSDITLWRGDFAQCAVAQASSFVDVKPDPVLLPITPQLWAYYAAFPSLTIDDQEYTVAASVVIPSKPVELVMVAQLLFEHEAESLETGSMRIIIDGVVEIGQPAGLHRGHELYSCLTFKDSRVAGTERTPISRADRRRIERTNSAVPDVHVVQLRRREATRAVANVEDANREYHYQWFVRPHVRKPNPRMKTQRPIWVPEYIKGPADKPLKPPTPTISVVKR